MAADAASMDLWHVGLYAQADAARYSGIPPSTVHRWLSRSGTHAGDINLVSFDEFVTLLFVRELRAQYVPFREIVSAEADLRERTGATHPFVHETLWTAARDVLVRVPEAPDMLISANRRGQIAMPQVVEAQRVKLRRLIEDVRGEVVYGDGRVMFWRPVERVAARPGVQFGLTCIEGTRLPTQVLYEAATAGDSNEDLARLYRVRETDVARAVAWERQLVA